MPAEGEPGYVAADNSQNRKPGGTTGTIQNAPNQMHPVNGYETCQNAATDRKNVSYHDVQNSGMPDQKG